MKAAIIKNLRKSIIIPQVRFLDGIGYSYDIVDIRNKSSKELHAVADDLLKKYSRIMFTNGTDTKDAELNRILMKKNPEVKTTFSELGWLPYQEYFYLDPKGIGNYSEFFGKRNGEIESMKITPVFNFYKDRTLYHLDNDQDHYFSSDKHDYVFVPLQVNGDSKMKIGSTIFKDMEEFVDYVVETVPKNLRVVFRNHPHNKKPIVIPDRSNVVNVTGRKLNKLDLISKAHSVWGVNSTFLLETLLMKRKVVSFGEDVFSGKPFIFEPKGAISFSKIQEGIQNIVFKDVDKFLCALMTRQLPRKEGIPFNYRNSYWGRKFLANS